MENIILIFFMKFRKYLDSSNMVDLILSYYIVFGLVSEVWPEIEKKDEYMIVNGLVLDRWRYFDQSVDILKRFRTHLS